MRFRLKANRVTGIASAYIEWPASIFKTNILETVHLVGKWHTVTNISLTRIVLGGREGEWYQPAHLSATLCAFSLTSKDTPRVPTLAPML